MTSSTVTALPVAGALGGNEAIYAAQGGVDVQLSPNQIKNFVGYTPLMAEADQRAFEGYLLSSPVGTFSLDGVTDCTYPFQYALNQIAADGQFHFITGWAGKTMFLGSLAGPATGPAGGATYYAQATGSGSGGNSIVKNGCFLAWPSNVYFDGRMMKILTTALAQASLSSCCVLVTSNPNHPGDYGLSYGYQAMGINRVWWQSTTFTQTAFQTATIVIDSKTQAGGCQYMTFEQNFFDNCGRNHVVSYNNAALNTFRNNTFDGCFAGLAGGTGSLGAGAGLYFASGNLGSGNNEANNLYGNKFTGNGIACISESSEIISTGDHFDYLRMALQIRQPGSIAGIPSGTPGGNAGFTHRSSFSQPHVECNLFQSHFDASNSTYFDAGLAQYHLITVTDPFIYINPNNNIGQQQLQYLFSSGTAVTPSVDPFGMNLAMGGAIVRNKATVDIPGSGAPVSLYRPAANGATGHLVYNGATVI